MRQRLLQHASRSLLIAPAGPASYSSTLRLAANALRRSTPICIHAQLPRPQRRHFADERGPRDGKPPISGQVPINLGAPLGEPSTNAHFEELIQQKAAEAKRKEAEKAKAAEEAAEAERKAAELEKERQAKAVDAQAEAEKKAKAELEEKANIEREAQQAPEEVTSAAANAQPETHRNGNELPSSSEMRRAALTKRFSHLMDNLQGKLFVASQHINDLTGYSSIDAMKREIIKHEAELAVSKEEVRVSRLNYKQLVADRAASQREVTTLLARKDSWTPVDLERFTQLYRSDHGNEHAVQEASRHLAEVERQAEQAASKLNSSILARYHEEQIWSDKIRRMSTWGTWGLMGVNVLLFLVFQFGFEPWRRERLTRGFEDKVKMALAHEREIEIERLSAATAQTEETSKVAAPSPVAAAAALEETEVSTNAQKEDPVAEVAPELITTIEEYADGQVPETDPLAGRHETEAEAVSEDEMSAALDGISLDAETEKLVTADPSEDPSAEPTAVVAPFLWSAPETWTPAITQSLQRSYTFCTKFARCASWHSKLLFSDRKVELRMLDVTAIALEGFATGAAIAGVVVMYIMKPSLAN